MEDTDSSSNLSRALAKAIRRPSGDPVRNVVTRALGADADSSHVEPVEQEPGRLQRFVVTGEACASDMMSRAGVSVPRRTRRPRVS
jgi:hypothetical protein